MTRSINNQPVRQADPRPKGTTRANGLVLRNDKDATRQFKHDELAIEMVRESEITAALSAAVAAFDADQLHVDFNPINYVPTIVGAPEALDADDLAAHLKGIDNALGVPAAARNESVWDTAGLTLGAPVYPTAIAVTAAHADASAPTTSNVVGIVGAIGAAGKVVTHGPVMAIFAGGDAGWAHGRPVFLSPLAGRVTFTAPTGPGETVIELGYLRDGTGLSATTVDGEMAEIHFNVGPRLD